MDVSRCICRYYIVICIKSRMSRQKGDAGFRESDAFASQLHWDLQLQGYFKSGVFATSLRYKVDFEESVGD